jgi:hypothetical protein
MVPAANLTDSGNPLRVAVMDVGNPPSFVAMLTIPRRLLAGRDTRNAHKQELLEPMDGIADSRAPRRAANDGNSLRRTRANPIYFASKGKARQ